MSRHETSGPRSLTLTTLTELEKEYNERKKQGQSQQPSFSDLKIQSRMNYARVSVKFDDVSFENCDVETAKPRDYVSLPITYPADHDTTHVLVEQKALVDAFNKRFPKHEPKATSVLHVLHITDEAMRNERDLFLEAFIIQQAAKNKKALTSDEVNRLMFDAKNAVKPKKFKGAVIGDEFVLSPDAGEGLYRETQQTAHQRSKTAHQRSIGDKLKRLVEFDFSDVTFKQGVVVPEFVLNLMSDREQAAEDLRKDKTSKTLKRVLREAEEACAMLAQKELFDGKYDGRLLLQQANLALQIEKGQRFYRGINFTSDIQFLSASEKQRADNDFANAKFSGDTVDICGVNLYRANFNHVRLGALEGPFTLKMDDKTHLTKVKRKGLSWDDCACIEYTFDGKTVSTTVSELYAKLKAQYQTLYKKGTLKRSDIKYLLEEDDAETNVGEKLFNALCHAQEKRGLWSGKYSSRTHEALQLALGELFTQQEAKKEPAEQRESTPEKEFRVAEEGSPRSSTDGSPNAVVMPITKALREQIVASGFPGGFVYCETTGEQFAENELVEFLKSDAGSNSTSFSDFIAHLKQKSKDVAFRQRMADSGKAPISEEAAYCILVRDIPAIFLSEDAPPHIRHLQQRFYLSKTVDVLVKKQRPDADEHMAAVRAQIDVAETQRNYEAYQAYDVLEKALRVCMTDGKFDLKKAATQENTSRLSEAAEAYKQHQATPAARGLDASLDVVGRVLDDGLDFAKGGWLASDFSELSRDKEDALVAAYKFTKTFGDPETVRRIDRQINLLYASAVAYATEGKGDKRYNSIEKLMTRADFPIVVLQDESFPVKWAKMPLEQHLEMRVARFLSVVDPLPDIKVPPSNLPFEDRLAFVRDFKGGQTYLVDAAARIAAMHAAMVTAKKAAAGDTARSPELQTFIEKQHYIAALMGAGHLKQAEVEFDALQAWAETNPAALVFDPEVIAGGVRALNDPKELREFVESSFATKMAAVAEVVKTAVAEKHHLLAVIKASEAPSDLLGQLVENLSQDKVVRSPGKGSKPGLFEHSKSFTQLFTEQAENRPLPLLILTDERKKTLLTDLQLANDESPRDALVGRLRILVERAILPSDAYAVSAKELKQHQERLMRYVAEYQRVLDEIRVPLLEAIQVLETLKSSFQSDADLTMMVDEKISLLGGRYGRCLRERDFVATTYKGVYEFLVAKNHRDIAQKFALLHLCDGNSLAVGGVFTNMDNCLAAVAGYGRITSMKALDSDYLSAMKGFVHGEWDKSNVMISRAAFHSKQPMVGGQLDAAVAKKTSDQSIQKKYQYYLILKATAEVAKEKIIEAKGDPAVLTEALLKVAAVIDQIKHDLEADGENKPGKKFYPKVEAARQQVSVVAPAPSSPALFSAEGQQRAASPTPSEKEKPQNDSGSGGQTPTS